MAWWSAQNYTTWSCIVNTMLATDDDDGDFESSHMTYKKYVQTDGCKSVCRFMGSHG